MNILKSKWFARWSKKSKVTDSDLIAAIKDFASPRVINLGGGLYKIRISRLNQGKSGGFRTILIYRKDDLALFVLGFAKNEKDNISNADLVDLKKQAKYIFNFSNKEIDKLIANETFVKVEVEDERRKAK